MRTPKMPPTRTPKRCDRINPVFKAAVERAAGKLPPITDSGTLSFRITQHLPHQRPDDRPEQTPDDRPDHQQKVVWIKTLSVETIETFECASDGWLECMSACLQNLNWTSSTAAISSVCCLGIPTKQSFILDGVSVRYALYTKKKPTRFAFMELPQAKASGGCERYAAAVALMLNSLPSRVVVIATGQGSDWVEMLCHDQAATPETDQTKRELGSGPVQSELIPIYRYHFDFDDDLWDAKMRGVIQVLTKGSARKEHTVNSTGGRLLVHPPPSSIASPET
ncbi:hypothetical protein GGTG_04611 [Gaeumannomyces tritici R3-111a-1]|uniref:Uncharacterized protein n=1 Tax=Gaeumannomyces tritici (strain R3-111a-1) TaxID=644352 RepID=J3NTL1_GAET3|nr:hypothetical protein GGTG_04611 [Gaeumannomyces tritici R3-111a-1]EJT79526.1 hypothetical protein GGTG_04611 [Gaeumannomyces tritici R3-111a-1]